MRGVIFGNGDIRDYEKMRRYVKDADIVICADGGIRHAEEMGIKPDAVIGDFDSSDIDRAGENVISYPTKKDFTDGELCVEYAVKHGCDELVLLGMTGTRLDHTISNILMLTECGGMIADENNEIYILKQRLEFRNMKGKTLSLIPIGGDLRGVSAKGLEYPLDNDTLFFGKSRGNSNVIISDLCTVSVKEGVGIAVVNGGE